MKKICILLTLIMLLSGLCAIAEEADITTVPTDIKVTLSGREIPAVCGDGQMFIAIEDTPFFGFHVGYDASLKTLHVNYIDRVTQGSPDTQKPAKLVPSNMPIYINGGHITGYAGENKMYVSADALGKCDKQGYTYGLKTEWDAENRTLAITHSGSFFTPEEAEEKYLEWIDPADKFSWHHGEDITGEGFKIGVCSQSGTPHGSYTYYMYYGEDGRIIDINSILTSYGFHDIWGHLTIRDITIPPNNFLSFKGTRMDGRTGHYELDLETLVLHTASETQPDDSKSSIPSMTTPGFVGKELEKASITVKIDGKPVNAYVIHDHCLIDSDVLLNFGFAKATSDRYVMYTHGGGTEKYNETPLEGKVVENQSTPTVMINGKAVTTCLAEGHTLISTANLERYFANNYGISAIWNSGTNTLEINTKYRTESFEEAKTATEKNPDCASYQKKYLYEGQDYSVLAFYSEEGNMVHAYKINRDGLVTDLYTIYSSVYGIHGVSEEAVEEDIFRLKTYDGRTFLLNLKTTRIDVI